MNTETKRHIDSARQVLVGVVPNPTSQIDQITNALIYKFMDDMDQAAIKAGGDASFFVGDLEKYAWTRLMDPRLGNQERMNLYSEALLKFSESKQLPELFRGIFKSAFLPYRSPETLGMFLKEINYFDYSHPEELGNAYEYLLSIMSSQGDAGQFRTPRHIIDFIVEAVNPTKDDKVLDPACGTAGFLISAYKHILAQHDGKDDPNKKEKPLTPDQRKNLFNNFEGYDIDPGMVRIAEVNMYLHQFKNPKIFQYDSLSMEERWNDKFDVIMANPPFMSPKGGIKPHTKFSIQSSRSEVLFVDYIMNHLRPHGRAGVIVPEGVIFQPGNAYLQLRKSLLENGLYAVISLPGGIFQPYSGVKTSILLVDAELSKQKTEILFLKINNDGFDLGSTKRVIVKNDLPLALDILNKWKVGEKKENELAVYVNKSSLNTSGNYNLSGDRYRKATDFSNIDWPMVELSDICEIESGSRQKGGAVSEGIYSIGGQQISSNNTIRFEKMKYITEHHFSEMKKGILKKGDILMVKDGATTGKMGYWDFDYKAAVNEHVFIFRVKTEVISRYLYNILLSEPFQHELKRFIKGIIGGISLEVKKIKIPLPPLEIQQQIVSELDSYQNILTGAKKIIFNWKPDIDIDITDDIPSIKVGKVVDFISGVTLAIGDCENEDGIPIITIADVAEDGSMKLGHIRKVKTSKNVNVLERGDLLFNWRNGSKNLVGKTAYFDLDGKYIFASFLLGIRPNKDVIDNKYLWFLLNKYRLDGKYMSFMRQNVNGLFNREELKDVVIPLPSLESQRKIVQKIEAERVLIDSAKKLIEIYEVKIKKKIGEVWGE